MAHPVAFDSLCDVRASQYEAHDVDNGSKEGFFCHYVITPVKDAVRYIVDGICTLCSNIRSFFISVCSPCCCDLQGEDDVSSKSSDVRDPVCQYGTDTDRYEVMGADGQFSGAAGKPEVPRFTSHDASQSRIRSQSDPGDDRKEESTMVPALGEEVSGKDISPIEEDEAVLMPLSTQQATSSSKSSVTQAVRADSRDKDKSSSSESFVSVESRFGSDKELDSSVPHTRKESSQSDDDHWLDSEGFIAALPSASNVDSEISSGGEGQRFLAESTISEGTLASEELTQSEGAVAAPLIVIDDEDISSPLQRSQPAASSMSKEYGWQSVFIQDRYQQPAYDNIRKFLIANPELARGGNYQESCYDLDFSKEDEAVKTKLKTRPEDYIAKGNVEKVDAEISIMPLVGVELFRNKLGGKRGNLLNPLAALKWYGETVKVTSCKNSYSCRWLSMENPPFLFVVHILLPNMSLIFNFAKPQLYPVEGGCQKLMDDLFYGSGTTFDLAVREFKIIPQVVECGIPPIKVPMLGEINFKSFMDKAAIVSNNFSYLPLTDKERVGVEKRYLEICMDMRASRIVSYGFDRIKRHANSLHLNLAFAVQPLDKKEQERRKVEKQLPEILAAGAEIEKPMLGAESDLDELDVSDSTVFEIKWPNVHVHNA